MQVSSSPDPQPFMPMPRLRHPRRLCVVVPAIQVAAAATLMYIDACVGGIDLFFDHPHGVSIQTAIEAGRLRPDVFLAGEAQAGLTSIHSPHRYVVGALLADMDTHIVAPTTAIAEPSSRLPAGRYHYLPGSTLSLAVGHYQQAGLLQQSEMSAHEAEPSAFGALLQEQDPETRLVLWDGPYQLALAARLAHDVDGGLPHRHHWRSVVYVRKDLADAEGLAHILSQQFMVAWKDLLAAPSMRILPGFDPCAALLSHSGFVAGFASAVGLDRPDTPGVP